MKWDSDAKFPEPFIGSAVKISVPDVDRGKLVMMKQAIERNEIIVNVGPI